MRASSSLGETVLLARNIKYVLAHKVLQSGMQTGMDYSYTDKDCC